MKRIYFIFCVILLLPWSIFGEDLKIISGQSRELILYPGEVNVATFIIHAPDDAALYLTTFERSCGCLGVPTLPKEIPASASASFTVSIRGNSVPGSKSEHIRIRGLVENKEVAYDFSIKITVEDELKRIGGTWKSVDLGDVHPQYSEDISLAFTRESHAKRWDNIEVSVEGSGLLESGSAKIVGNDVSVKITLKYTGMIGQVSGRAIFSFLSGGQPLPYHPSVIIRANVVGPVSASPSSVVLGNITVNDIGMARVDLESNEGRPLHVSSIISTDSSRLSAMLHQDGNLTWINISLLGTEPVGQASGWIDIHIDDPYRVVLRVPYRASIGQMIRP